MVSGRNLGRFGPNSDAGADPRDELQRVDLVELLHHISAEQVAGAPRREAPPGDLLGVAPHEVAHRAVVRNLRESARAQEEEEEVGITDRL